MLKKVGGVVLMLFGVVGLFTMSDGFSFSTLVIAVAFMFLGYKLFKGKSKSKVIAKTVTAPTSNIPTKKKVTNQLSFRVAGISKKNDRQEDIQKLIKEYVAEAIELGHTEAYEEMTNAEIKEDGGEFYEADLYGYDEIELIPEPTNPHDPNAIKVMHEEIGHIGYVPAEYTEQVKSIMDKDYEVEWKLLGGKMKYVDEDDKVKTKTLTYGIAIDLDYV